MQRLLSAHVSSHRICYVPVMKASTIYGLVGLVALGLLTFVQWLRSHAAGDGHVQAFLLGVAPNFAAALAITFVVLSAWADQNPKATRLESRRAWLGASIFSGTGLAGWEFFQKTNASFVFDPYDLAATGLGLATGAAVFAIIPTSEDE